MSYAIIETGGKQLRVEPGRFYDIELLHVDPEEQVTINKVLLVQHDGDVTIGQPFIEGATVEGTVMRHRRGKKVIVYKMRPKKKTRKKRGHRQEITQLMINSITLNGSVIEQEVADEAQAAQTTIVAEEPAVETATAEETPDLQTVETQAVEVAPIAEEPDVETSGTEEPAPSETVEAQVAEVAPVAEEPAVVEAAPEETTSTVIEQAQAADTIPVAEEPDVEASATQEPAPPETVEAPTADEPDAQTIEPDQAQQAVENVVAEEPDAETGAPEETTESESQ